MSETQYTPGPWSLRPAQGITYITSSAGIICTIYHRRSDESDLVAQANSQIISAGPELLEGAKALIEKLGDNGGAEGEALQNAIAKAEGTLEPESK